MSSNGSNAALPGTGGNAGYTRTVHNVEEQNDERLEGLLGKVKILKDVSCDNASSAAGCQAGSRREGCLCSDYDGDRKRGAGQQSPARKHGECLGLVPSSSCVRQGLGDWMQYTLYVLLTRRTTLLPRHRRFWEAHSDG